VPEKPLLPDNVLKPYKRSVKIYRQQGRDVGLLLRHVGLGDRLLTEQHYKGLEGL
jgi:hypothetical protein